MKKSDQSLSSQIKDRSFAGSWAVIGGTGWIGSNVVKLARDLGVKVDVYGSTDRNVNIAGIQTKVAKFSASNLFDQYEVIWDCAFATREKLLANPALSRINDDLLKQSRILLEQSPPSLYVYFSSGAAIHPDFDFDVYGLQKAEAEKVFSTLKNQEGLDIRVGRIWSISGAYCLKRQQFAITSMIDEARRDSRITIRADFEVWRRYCSIRQFLGALLVDDGQDSPLDSGGSLVEIGELAKIVLEVFAPHGHVIRSKTSAERPSNYYSTSARFEELMNRLGETPEDLYQQVLSSV